MLCTVEGFDVRCGVGADRVGVARGVVGVVGVQTLHTETCPPNPTRGTVEWRVTLDERVTVPLVPIRCLSILGGEYWIGFNAGFSLLDPACGLEPSDASRRKRAGQPIGSGERGPVIEVRWDLDNSGKSKMTTPDDIDN